MTHPNPQPVTNESSRRIHQYINLKLAALGQPGAEDGDPLVEVAQPLLRNHREKSRLLDNRLCPVDARIQAFVEAYLTDVDGPSISLPGDSLTLDRPGLARVLSLPPDQDSFTSDIVSTYRVKQGILHNPKNDRRTTEGVFHIAEGGLPIPGDKRAVPKAVFRRLLAASLRPPEDLLALPYTANRFTQAKVWVSLLLRPLVCPAIPGRRPAKSMEVRFFAPGNLVGNLDFVESIFGNGGDPFLPENDAALDTDHWTGHSGCVILAPHLTRLKKKDLGLPSIHQATDRQKRDRLCWTDPEELYNDGQAFKVAARDQRGVMVTVIADNYFGYCKKEVKTQISFSANLYGWAEEEHAGGALVFPSYDLGVRFQQEERLIPQNGLTFMEMTAIFGAVMELKPEGYAVDRTHSDILYVPEDTVFDLIEKTVSWTWNGEPMSLPLLARHIYILPNGYKVRLTRTTDGQGWHLTGTSAEGTLCHKPSTVSGGGKSEISKSIDDAMIQGPVFVADFQKDMETLESIVRRDYGDRFRNPRLLTRPSRPILSPSRSLGSVIKLLTPALEYTDAFNAWLAAIPPHILDMVFVLKRFHRPELGDDWRRFFSVDNINGSTGHELKLAGHRLRASYLRVGYDQDGSRRICRVRQDFDNAEKIQMEDDITVSVVVPRSDIDGLGETSTGPSVKLVANCEQRLFQRPDDAIRPGYDKQTEADMAGRNIFLSNWEPLTRPQVAGLVEDVLVFDQFSQPWKDMATDFLLSERPAFLVSSAHPRLVGGKPSKNPRYLQERPDLANPRAVAVAEMGVRLFRKILLGKPVPCPVIAVLPARRNNPPEPAIGAPPLCVYNPIHYQELPELFMDFIASLTGKSPSTTGFGSEGALTKSPFNALPPIIDLNNALVAFILTGAQGFSTAAGYIGPRFRVDHDISLLVPEIWARLSSTERDPSFLIKEGYLEKVADFDHRGRRVPASRLGFRITRRFVRGFLGRIFNNPNVVFPDDMLQPERQSADVFADGVEAIASAHQKVAAGYFEDGSLAAACPPLEALLTIMARGDWRGKGLNDPEVRSLFTLETLLQSSWYKERLEAQQRQESALWQRNVAALKGALRDFPAEVHQGLGLPERLMRAHAELARTASLDYLGQLNGYSGVDPFGTGDRLVPGTSPRARGKKSLDN